MVSFTVILAAALALVSPATTAPSGQLEDSISTSLNTRQGSPWQWWTEGSGQFSCQQQGGGKYSCSWNGKSGGGMVAGTGCKCEPIRILFLLLTSPHPYSYFLLANLDMN